MGNLTSFEKKEIERMFEQGYSIKQISKSFKAKSPGICKVLNKYEIFQHKDDFYNLDLLYKLRDLNSQGLFKSEICEKLNMELDKFNLYFHIVKIKCPTNEFDKLGFTREDVFKVIVLFEKGCTYAEVGLKLGKKAETVRKCVRCLISYGVYLKKGKIKYSEGLKLSGLEDEYKEHNSTEKKPIIDSKITNGFMLLKSKGYSDEKVSKELNISMQTIAQLKEECEKYKVFFNS